MFGLAKVAMPAINVVRGKYALEPSVAARITAGRLPPPWTVGGQRRLLFVRLVGVVGLDRAHYCSATEYAIVGHFLQAFRKR